MMIHERPIPGGGEPEKGMVEAVGGETAGGETPGGGAEGEMADAEEETSYGCCRVSDS